MSQDPQEPQTSTSEPRSDREDGGPVAGRDAPESGGGATGTRPAPFEPHDSESDEDISPREDIAG